MQFAKTLAISALVIAVAAQEIGDGVQITKSNTSATKTDTKANTSPTSSNTETDAGKGDGGKPVDEDKPKNGAGRVAGSLAAAAVAA
ncbi:hypothetical protein GGI20_001252 [Coemansia sp. BCRC 34301]|nr:hypothetical protein GGI20_001252 [Coemansia sp. BCRC 34301]